MQREMDEVLRSQQVMLGKAEQVQKNAYPVVLAEAFRKQVEKAEAWIKQSPNAEVVFVNYQQVIDHPAETAERIAEFLDEDLDIEKMANCVDPQLHRNKFTTKIL